jgi:seryl-tRNA synthetase
VSALREGPIENEEFFESVARAQVERYRFADALAETEEEARGLRRELANLQRDAQIDAGRIHRLSDAHDALYAELAKECARNAKLKRKLAKAKAPRDAQ